MNMKQKKKNFLRERLQQSLVPESGLAKKVSGTGLNRKASVSGLSVTKKPSGTNLVRKAPEPEPEIEASPVEGPNVTDFSDDELLEFDGSNVSSPVGENYDDGDFIDAMEELANPDILHDDGDSDEQLPAADEGPADQSEEPVSKKKKKSSPTGEHTRSGGVQKRIKIQPGEPFGAVKGVTAKTCLNRGKSLFEIKRKEALVRLRIAEEELRCTKVRTKIVIANKKAMKEIMENQIALSSKQSVL